MSCFYCSNRLINNNYQICYNNSNTLNKFEEEND